VALVRSTKVYMETQHNYYNHKVLQKYLHLAHIRQADLGVWWPVTKEGTDS